MLILLHPFKAQTAAAEHMLIRTFLNAHHNTGCDPVLGPEMRSTGEVMGIDETFSGAYAKAQASVFCVFLFLVHVKKNRQW